ncbi:MAG: glycosyltransferase family 1 protein [Candidatus Saccharimonas sp.]
MKVLFDARWILIENRFDGVSRYSYELARTLAKRSGLEIAWLIHDKRQLAKLPPGDYVLANDPNNGWKEFWSLARTINRSGYKYVYSPFFVMGTLGKHYKLVLTIHDMIYFSYKTPPQWLPWLTRLGWRLFHLTYLPMRWQLNHADVVATVSNTARDELVLKRATKRPIVTVPNAVGNQFYDPTERERHNFKNIVYIGSFTPYKNVECLIDMMSLLPDMTLHLCGKLPPARRPSIEKRIHDRGVSERVVLYDGATDEQYRQALSQACCAISASRIEGFGLQIIEAQCAGVPFIGSNTAIFHEIGEDSILYFDPLDPEQAAVQVQKLQNQKTSQEYTRKGYQNSMRYTWDKSAERAVKLIEALDK